ncbi:hypothetical protein [uncultured Tateyamaria sp.]|uniref:SPW repeat domain-containing protein n=1 Tax=uncultured Tateyamaria sp. TaxID=455651 RepID=UPI002637CA0E|nr:hypothetical protein [uncultured Tateyamaria sp.]
MFRFMTQKMHAYIDYPVALGLIVMPFVLGIGMTNAWAFALSVFTGIAALVLTALTNHETGLMPVLPYKSHLAIDAIVGVTFVAAPFLFGFTGLDALYFWVLGATVLVVVGAHDADSTPTMIQPAE